MMLWLLFFFLIGLADSQDRCANAPNADARKICQMLQRWDGFARAGAAKRNSAALPPGGRIAAAFAPIASSLYQCMDLKCMCVYVNGKVGPGGSCILRNGQQLKKAIRKEYRLMTDDERQRYHAAVKQLKETGEYDRMTRIHTDADKAGGAHAGPAFLPWHREFLKRMEQAIRQIDPTLYLPYWDETLEHNLVRPNDSILFSEELMGSTDSQGHLINGPFGPRWNTLQVNHPNGSLAYPAGTHIVRKVHRSGSPVGQADIDSMLRKTRIEDILSFSGGTRGCKFQYDWGSPEAVHNNVHLFIGGTMEDTLTAANDPIFYLHHSFVDYMWEMWRLKKQTRAQRETQFPEDNQLCSAPQHFNNQILQPFTPIVNRDGISNMYTDNLYEFAPRPTCTSSPPDCGSKYLFCDLTNPNNQDPRGPRCASKMRPGSRCSMYKRGENPCYNGHCSGGVCVESGPNPSPRPTTPSTKRPTTIESQETCYNENTCCGTWATAGECARNPGYMSEYCKASCGQCHPKYHLADDCSDRHKNCPNWASSGECQQNPSWMNENCRSSCKKCGKTRNQECHGTAGNNKNDDVTCNNSAGCFNENVCCGYWASIGQCRVNATYMSCNCRVSCGYCNPVGYNFGACEDYHHHCQEWARLGECQVNPWTTENCRRSCGFCLSSNELPNICGRRAGAVAPLGHGPQNLQLNRNGAVPEWGGQWGNGPDYEDGRNDPRWG